uniref:K Homology domain-containing protein n=1 Tax=Pseudictyota dubia TaxID=2749911 RepID=A0A7R9WB75_9STRA|mmetsp:Transcript_42255/g.78221  ORF Transcript_42255/g.78221 Transcript_42255/m.78221 type:complete len:799 (+) Transcript_42255:474-2870(+)|eukprot:CAMPEP_0197445460 /NCGR_PEP_ID=MMETSP1175-20131217/10673_1 /TAXON_ID=1003142 /ORGANISM="Triceratium dubium, Strain CCMP147" /LENGTH=798 /DNA_ID=CAMNT_0042976421 /DNA_START=472 /DNA_END=2868 /DNA_ORIENTATION=+
MDRSGREDEGNPSQPVTASSAHGNASHPKQHIHFSDESCAQHYQPPQQPHQQSYYAQSAEGFEQEQHSASSFTDSVPLHEQDDINEGSSDRDGKSGGNSTPPPALTSTTPRTMTPTSSAATSSTRDDMLSSPSRRGSNPGRNVHGPAPALPTSSPPAPSPVPESGPITAPSPAQSSEPPISSAGDSVPVTPAPASGGGGSVSGGMYQDQSAGSQVGLVSVKLLVSNNVAGSIIGRSGQTISELQARSSARIKLSQAGDCFPGTSDRVCLVQGGLDGVKSAIGLVLRKLHELQRPPLTGIQQQTVQGPMATEEAQLHQMGGVLPGLVQSNSHPHLSSVGGSINERGVSAPVLSPSFAFVVRLLVPTPSCGMIIGRGGSNVKSMAETSGVTSIRLSPKENEAVLAATSERVVTITGPSLTSVVRCTSLILDGMATHPDICRYANMTTSYSRASSVLSAAQQAAAAAAIASSSIGVPTVVQGAYGAATTVGVGAAGPVTLAPSSPSPHRQRHDQTSRPSSSSLQHASVSSGGAPQQLLGTHLVGLASSGGGGSAGSHQAQLRYAPVGRSSEQGSSGALPPPPPPPSPIMAPMVPLPSSLPASGPTTFAQHGSGQYLPPATTSSTQQQQQSIYVLAPSSSAAPTQAARVSSAGPSRRSSASSVGLPSATDQLASMQISSMTSGAGDESQQQHTYSQPQQLSLLPSQGPTASHSQAPPPSASNTVQIAVPDTLIGAILGRDGQTLKELQMSTGTRIKISQRGVYVPGTNHRVVTISGPTAESVSTAQFMIGQRLAMRPRTDLR